MSTLQMEIMAALEIRGELGELRRMSAWLREGCEAYGLASTATDDLELCANEAVTNIVTHSYREQPGFRVWLNLSMEADGVRLDIEDEAAPYDPLTQAPRKPLPGSLEEATVGGLGVHLIRNLMRECRYVRRSGRNVLTLLTGPAAGSYPGT